MRVNNQSNSAPASAPAAEPQPPELAAGGQQVSNSAEAIPTGRQPSEIGTSRRHEAELQTQARRAQIESHLPGQAAPANRLETSGRPGDLSHVPIFQQGLNGERMLDGNHVVNMFSQMTAGSGVFNPNRCGPTVGIAASIMNGGQVGLSKFAGSVRQLATSDRQRRELDQIRRRIDGGEATYGDLARLNEHAFNVYAVPDQNGHLSTTSGDMTDMMRNGGAGHRDAVPRSIDDFAPGQSWPFLMDTDDDGIPNHWVLAGRDQNNQPYVYDPNPQNRGQLHTPPSAEYNHYAQLLSHQQSAADENERMRHRYGADDQRPRPGWAPPHVLNL